MTSKVKLFHSAMTGIPALSGTAGALITLLDAILVNGYGSTNVATLSVTAGVATATFASGHPFVRDSTALFAGATPSPLNGEKRILSVAANSVTFDATGVADGAATGTITTKVAAAGWEKAFSGTNVAVYRSLDVGSTRCYLRIDDTGTTNARFISYEYMSDANTGVNPCPLPSQVSGGLYLPKSNAASAAARPWAMVADQYGFHIALDPGGNGRYSLLYSGDIASLKNGDAYSFSVTGNLSDQTAVSSAPDGCNGYSRRSSNFGCYVQRSSTAVGQAVAAQRVGAHHNGTSAAVYAGTAGYSWGTYPNVPNNGLLTCPLELTVGNSIRGSIPGLLHPIQDCGPMFSTFARVDGTDDLAGKTLMAFRVGPPSSGDLGTVFIDITGPWSR